MTDSILSVVEIYYCIPASESVQDAVLIFTDAHGINSRSNRLLADSFAANGFFAVMPDLFRGSSLPLNIPDGFDYNAWERRNLPANVEPLVHAVINGMRSRGAVRIGGVGYAVGTKYLARFMGPGRLCAGFMSDPWWLEKEDILAINKPLSIVFGKWYLGVRILRGLHTIICFGGMTNKELRKTDR